MESHASPTRWAVDAGLGIRLWRNDEGFREKRDYLEQTRLGLTTGIEVAVFPWQEHAAGLGIVHSRFSASVSDPDIAFPDGSRGRAHDDYTIHYVAPTAYYARVFADQRTSALFSAGAGPVFYRNETYEGAFPGVLQGMTWGAHVAAAVDYRILPRVGLGATARLTSGSLAELRYNAVDVEVSPVSLARLDVTVGLRVYP